MPSKKAKVALEAVNSKIRQWKYEVHQTPQEYRGKLKDENGKTVIEIIENIDFNQLTRLLKTSKYMDHEHDMRGLAKYIWERGLVKMDEEERDEWKTKKAVPIVITEVKL